jgi:hypothetical protein
MSVLRAVPIGDGRFQSRSVNIEGGSERSWHELRAQP